MLRSGAFPLGGEVRVGVGMAEFLGASRRAQCSGGDRHDAWDAANRGPVRTMRCASRPRVPGRTGSDGAAVLHQLGVAEIREERLVPVHGAVRLRTSAFGDRTYAGAEALRMLKL